MLQDGDASEQVLGDESLVDRVDASVSPADDASAGAGADTCRSKQLEHPMLPRFRDLGASMDLVAGGFRARMRWLCRRLAQGKATR